MVRLPKVSVDTDMSDGLCFGCGPNNPHGLKLHFEWDGKTARARFTPTKHHEGWRGVVHGGIIATVLDEVMTYSVHFSGLNCLTVRLNIALKRPARAGETLAVSGWIVRNTRKLIETQATILSPDGSLVAEATATQFILGASQLTGATKEGTRSDAGK